MSALDFVRSMPLVLCPCDGTPSVLRALSHSALSASVWLFCAAGGDELRCAVLQVRICQRAYKLLVETVRPPARHRIGPQAPMCHAAGKRQQERGPSLGVQDGSIDGSCFR